MMQAERSGKQNIAEGCMASENRSGRQYGGGC